MIKLVRTNVDDKNFVHLVNLLNQEFLEKYEKQKAQFTSSNQLDKNSKVILAFDNTNLVGCGAFRPLKEDKAIEIGCLYIYPKARGKGISKIILNQLEAWALEECYNQVKLHTSLEQTEAVSLYQKSGYNTTETRITPESNTECIYMMKQLTD